MLNQEILNKATNHLVQQFNPGKIILFGSQARGTANKHSDIDLLIISPIQENRRKLMLAMDSALDDIECAFDILVLTQEEFNEDRNIPGTVSRYASQEGKILYEQP